jgi:hypothetical protein
MWYNNLCNTLQRWTTCPMQVDGDSESFSRSPAHRNYSCAVMCLLRRILQAAPLTWSFSDAFKSAHATFVTLLLILVIISYHESAYGLDGPGSIPFMAIFLFSPQRSNLPGALFLGVKRPEREADHSSASAEGKNGGSIPPLPHMYPWRRA